MKTIFEFYHPKKHKWIHKVFFGVVSDERISRYVAREGGDSFNVISRQTENGKKEGL